MEDESFERCPPNNVLEQIEQHSDDTKQRTHPNEQHQATEDANEDFVHGGDYEQPEDEPQEKRCETSPLRHFQGQGRYIGRIAKIGQVERLVRSTRRLPDGNQEWP